MMKHLPNMLAFDPNMLSRFPGHLRKDWARKELGELATWLLKTENAGACNEISMAIAKKIKNSLVVRAVLTGDRAERRAMAAWRRRVVIMIPSNMTDVLARVLGVLAGFALVHRRARGKVTLESTSCTDLESWIGIEVRLAVVISAVTDVARELTFLFSSHARARALSTGQPDARRLAATHEDAELPNEPHGRARASPREGAWRLCEGVQLRHLREARPLPQREGLRSGGGDVPPQEFDSGAERSVRLKGCYGRCEN